MEKFFFCFIAFISALTNSFAQGKYLETIKVTDSIYVFKPKIDWAHGNGIAIIGKEGVFFIDTYQETTYAAEAIKKLKTITKLPVQFVLNTHWHNDHVIGNYEFKKTYPGCKIIMHDSTMVYMNAIIAPAIDSDMVTSIQGVKQLEREISNKKADRGFELTPALLDFWKWQLQEVKEYIRDFRPNKFTNADITFNDSLTFHWGSQTLQLVYANDNGHSEGDVIVWIPEKKLVITGDIVVGPTPYATQNNIPGMLRSIQRIIDLNPSILIPGHGFVQYDLNYVNLLKEAFTAYRNAALAAIEKGTPVRDAMNNINFPVIDKKFTGDDDLKKWAYRTFFYRWVIYHTYNEKGVVPKQ